MNGSGGVRGKLVVMSTDRGVLCGRVLMVGCWWRTRRQQQCHPKGRGAPTANRPKAAVTRSSVDDACPNAAGWVDKVTLVRVSIIGETTGHGCAFVPQQVIDLKHRTSGLRVRTAHVAGGDNMIGT